ncbi:MAG: 3-phenylpropionate/cinnamic acid dioxygenase subunit beta [Pseudomonadota bacterium]|nr:3-phenylpropionate/cinnamic acid dioxygenase subunit beta [Pseudomonadota bacterium]
MASTVEKTSAVAGQPVDRETHFEIERFLVREARLLDQERLHEWLELLTPDIRYLLPVNEIRYRDDTAPIGTATGTHIFDEDYRQLEMRVNRMDTKLVWFEDPKNIARRLITNIDAEWTDVPGEADVYSTFLVYRNRRQRDETWLVGAREDRLRLTDTGWRLARRNILLDQRVVLDKNLHLMM